MDNHGAGVDDLEAPGIATGKRHGLPPDLWIWPKDA